MRLLIVLAGLILVVGVAAQSGADTYTTHTSTGIGGGTIEQRWVVTYPYQRPDGNVSHVSVTVDSVTAASSSYALSIETTALTGCAVEGTPVTTGTTLGATLRAQLNLTADDCHGTFRFLLTSGTAQARVSARIAILAPDQTMDAGDSWSQMISKFAFLFWLAYFVLSRLIRAPWVPWASIMRIIADLVGFGLLKLPDLPADQFARLATATYAVLILDLFQLMRAPGDD